MKTRLFYVTLFLLMLLITPALSFSAPVILYTDITSGPNTGGENNNGAYLSIFGKNFGSDITAITVTVGGGQVARKMYLGASRGRTDIQQLSVQLGPTTATGAIQVVVGGVGSNTNQTFTVRSGNIYFAATNGNDSNTGSFASPWLNLDVAKSRLFPGDILMVMDGVTATRGDTIGGADSVLRITTTNNSARSGTQTQPIAVVAYPGATVTIGAVASGPATGFRMYLPWWVASGLSLRGSWDAEEVNGYLLPTVDGARVVNCDLTGGHYTLSIDASNHPQLLGNTFHDSPNSALYVNGSDISDSSDYNIGWNVFHDIGTFGVKLYYAPPTRGPVPRHTNDQILVHDNLFYNFVRAPILCGGHDWGDYPWLKTVSIYNNIIYGVSNSAEGSIRIANNGGNETLLDVSVLNNTVYLDAGAGSATSFEMDATRTAKIENNLFVQTVGNYIYSTVGPGTLTWDHNGYYGGSNVPSQDTNPITSAPLFVNSGTHDFHLQATSPYVNTGVSTGISLDHDGVTRPQGLAYDIGAFEYVGGGGNVFPMVTLSANTTSGNAPLAVNFTANASDTDGTITQYEWDLDGNGSYEAPNNSNVSNYTYNSAGTYSARVRVTDNGGATATSVVTITVNSSSSGGGSGSGGDSGGGSGGGGCGFVKDNGKGQKAKGEGLSFAMMLIIALAGIAIARRVSNRFSYNL